MMKKNLLHKSIFALFGLTLFPAQGFIKKLTQHKQVQTEKPISPSETFLPKKSIQVNEAALSIPKPATTM